MPSSGQPRKAVYSETKFAAVGHVPLHTGLVPRIDCLEADVVTLRDKCARLETEAKILHEHVRDLEDGRMEDRLVVEELRRHLLRTQRCFHAAGLAVYDDDAEMEIDMGFAGASSASASASCGVSSKVSRGGMRMPPGYVCYEAGGAAANSGELNGREARHPLDDTDDGATARRQRIKQRVPTAFPRGAPLDEEEHEDPPQRPVPHQVKQRSAMASTLSTGSTSSFSGPKTIVFRERDSITEIDNCVTGENSGPILRSIQKRMVEARPELVQQTSSSRVGFNPRDDDECPDRRADESVRRKLKSRQPTGYARDAPEPEEEVEESRWVTFDAEAEADGRGQPRGKQIRVPTSFVYGSQDEDDDDDAELDESEEFYDVYHPQKVKIKSKAGLGEARDTAATRRVPTGFVRNLPDDEEEEEEDRRGVSFKAGTRGEASSGTRRVPTAFPRNSQLDEEDEDERRGVSFTSGTAFEAKRGKVRVPTAFPRNVPVYDEDEAVGRGVSFTAGTNGEAKRGKIRVPTAFPRNAPLDDEDEAERRGVSFTAGTHGEARRGKIRVPTAFPRNVPVDDEDESRGVSFTPGTNGRPREGHKRVPTAFPRNVPLYDEEEEGRGVSFSPGTNGEGRNGQMKRVPTAFPRNARAGDEEEEAEAKVTFKEAAGGQPRAGKKIRVPTAFPTSVPADEEYDTESEDQNQGVSPKKGVSFHGPSSAGGTGGRVKRVPTSFPRGEASDDAQGNGVERRAVAFHPEDTVEEINHGDGSGKRRPVQKRIPTAFVFARGESGFGDDGEEVGCLDSLHSRGSSVRTATFNDAVSESDPESIDEEILKRGRPSRGRIPTSFLRTVPGYDRDKTLDSGSEFSGAYSPSRRSQSGGDSSPMSPSRRLSSVHSPCRRPDRARLPTALGRRKSEEDLEEVLVMRCPSTGTFDPTPLEINLERFRQIDAAKDKGLIEHSLRKLDIFSDIDDSACKTIVDAMAVFKIPAGTAIARQGNRNATHFFVIQEGLFDITRDGKKVAEVAEGALLGESVILLSGAQNATVTARIPAIAYGLAGAKARNILQQQYQEGKKDVIDAVREMLHGKSSLCPLFVCLSQYQENLLFEGAECKNFAAGDFLVSRGQTECKGLYIILKGTTKVFSATSGECHNYGRNSIAGEMLMLYGQALADIVCSSPVQTLRLSHDLLQRMFGDKLQDQLLKIRVRSMLLTHKPFASFSHDNLDAVANLGEVITIEPGEEVIKDGVCLALSIFGEGVEAEIMGEQPDVPDLVNKTTMSGVMGTALGQDRIVAAEDSLLPWKLRMKASADVQARVVIWGTALSPMIKVSMIKRDDEQERAGTCGIGYDYCSSPSTSRLLRSPSMRIAVAQDDKDGALRKVLVFRTLTNEQITELAKELQAGHVMPGEVIFNQGDKGDEFYIIHAGLVEVSINGKKVRTLGVGDYVGERALLFSEPRSATVTAVVECELWRIGREPFERVVVRGAGEAITAYMKDRIAFQNTKVEIDSLKCLRIVGRGGYGVVKMVQSTQTQTRYALKCVKIKTAVREKQTFSLLAERRILAELDHPFVIKFIRTFRSKQYVYFLMELVTGGELLDALQVLQLLTVPQAQFYTGSIILALEFLHDRRIAYLDLKGENCLIDIHGYVKIIDFGIAERLVNGKLFEQRGTVYYMAPETLLGRGYTTVADLWSLGVCVYDFFTGTFPFGNEITDPTNACGQNLIYEEIRKADLLFPKTLKNQAAKSFISGLLERDVTKRLGAGQTGYAELKRHDFFKGFKWDELLARQIEPPYKPQGEVYAEEEGTACEKELVVVEDDSDSDDGQEVWVRGLSGRFGVANGRYEVAGQHDGRPYLKHPTEDYFMYHTSDSNGAGQWCLAGKLDDAPSEVWIASSHESEERRVCPPTEGWLAKAARGNPRVKVYMDHDPSWLEEF